MQFRGRVRERMGVVMRKVGTWQGGSDALPSNGVLEGDKVIISLGFLGGASSSTAPFLLATGPLASLPF